MKMFAKKFDLRLLTWILNHVLFLIITQPKHERNMVSGKRVTEQVYLFFVLI